jgi:sulfur relay (sulfurtransferase) DsrC/TusE family protein
MTRREPPWVRHITYYDRSYRVDIYGYLLDPDEWTERFARRAASEMGMGRLTARQWDVLGSLRERFSETGTIPTPSETCRRLGISPEDLEESFPLGYLRCAVKLAGLNPVRRTTPA